MNQLSNEKQARFEDGSWGKYQEVSDKAHRVLKDSGLIYTSGKIRIDMMMDRNGNIMVIEAEGDMADCAPTINKDVFDQKESEILLQMICDVCSDSFDISLSRAQPARRTRSSTSSQVLRRPSPSNTSTLRECVCR